MNRNCKEGMTQKWKGQADLGANKSIELLEMKIKISKISKQLNSRENTNEERIANIEAMKYLPRMYPRNTNRWKKIGRREEYGRFDVWLEFQKERVEKTAGTTFKAIMAGELFRINECFRKLPRVPSGINISKSSLGQFIVKSENPKDKNS